MSANRESERWSYPICTFLLKLTVKQIYNRVHIVK